MFGNLKQFFYLEVNMEGLTYSELQELLAYVEKHHSWLNMYENHCNNKDAPLKTIKYVRFHFDI